jgi:hypothetical protein
VPRGIDFSHTHMLARLRTASHRATLAPDPGPPRLTIAKSEWNNADILHQGARRGDPDLRLLVQPQGARGQARTAS